MTRKILMSEAPLAKVKKRRVMKRKVIGPAKAKAKIAPSSVGTVIVRSGAGKVHFVYTFGGAQLSSARDPQDSKDTFEQSRKAMEEFGRRIVRPGIRLPDRKGVPKFYADEVNPKVIVRELDGKRERGTFENGQFKAIA